MTQVSAGEVCTVDLANHNKMLNPTNTDIADSYNLKINDLSTLNSTTSRFCSYDTEKKKAYGNCGLTYGIGFSSDGTSNCVLKTCPNDLPVDPNDPHTCQKTESVIEAAVTNETAKCDEKWSDWFTLRNYHLGNRYSKHPTNNTCLAPCGPYQVPNFARDPVDAESLDLTSKTDVSTCVNKENYFSGKYSYTSDYCPIAWIKRIGASHEE